MTTIERTLVEDLLAKVEDIRPVIERNREWNEANHRLSDEVYDAMIGAGLFRLIIPRAFGGYEMHPVDAYRIYWAVSRIDAATGWNLQIAAAAAGFAPWLPAAGGEEVFAAGPDTISAGAFFPPAAAVRVPGGFRVTGRTPFASGCDRAQWLLMPGMEMDGDQPKLNPATGQPDGLVLFFPRADVQVIPNWNTLGMRGTGSNDIAVNDVFVPDHRVGVIGPLTDPPPAFAGPLYRLFPMTGIHTESIPSVASAERAIEDLVELAKNKTANYSTVRLADRELVQHHIGKAKSLVGAARSYLFGSISDAFDSVVRDGRMTEHDKKECQLAACFAAEASAEAVDIIHEAAGSSGFRLEQPFERYFRDVHTLSQHASKSVNRYTSVGMLEVGLPPDWFGLAI
jgi:alkylation response protein AidB-like acyl-CoA dehydrogenase